MIPKNKRKTGVIYVNKDEAGNPLTFSVLHKLSSGDIIEIERNSRGPLRPFLKKFKF